MRKTYDYTSRQLTLLLTFLALALYVSAQGDVLRTDEESYRLIELKADSLPSLNTARSGHATFCIDGTLMVFGGHTEGFVPTPTAEYLRDGAWHTVSLAYPHDHGAAIELRSGKVLLAGGHKEELGVGQLYSAEIYDPATHTSRGFGCLDKNRAYANAVEMADGLVVIAGNWFADDGIEMFGNVYDPMIVNAVKVKDVSFARAKPYILRITDDDAIIFGSIDEKAEAVDCGVVDRLKGSAYREPFLDTWHPLRTINNSRSANHFVGNEGEGRYEWLLPVEHAETGQVAIARVTGPADSCSYAAFSLLPTRQPLPDSINGKHIIYSSLVCDRNRGLAYLIGNDDDACVYVAAVHYDSKDPSPLVIYVTEPQPVMAKNGTPVLTPEGDLVFAGGHLVNNFSTSNAVFRLPLGKPQASAADVAESGGFGLWGYAVVAVCLIACGIAAVHLMRRKKPAEPVEPAEAAPAPAPAPASDTGIADLFNRIEQLMEDEQLYLNPELRASDVAARVGSNTAYVSAAVNSQRGCSFTQFLTAYRITYAQNLLRQKPEMKISEISTLSGFSTDSTFFRAFKTTTGMSPKEWLAAIRDNQQP